jgi:CheY-like chemotaxis protein
MAAIRLASGQVPAMSNQPTLLIVDDSRMSRMLIRAVVSQQRPDWILVEAASGDEALARVEENPPSFVSMDVNMPGMSGMEAAGRIRLRYPDIRIALCTANIQESTQQGAERAGLSFIKKPITEESIGRMIACFEEAHA